MHVYQELPRAPITQNLALSIGTFDGVHRGHQILIEKLKREAKMRQLQAAVLTFQDMPYCYFKPESCPHLLTLPNEKIAAFAPSNIAHLFIVPFDAGIAQQSALDFCEALKHNLGVKLLVIGPDFALGRGRDGDVTTLRSIGRDLDFEVVVLDEKLLYENRAISSTRVREDVEGGQIENAARLLGRPFSLAGVVVGGQQLGRKIGVPTINIQPHSRKVLPQNGVYAVRAFFDEQNIPHRAALNIGMRPTVDGLKQTIEFHVIGETIEIPPHQVRLDLVARLRAEQKFPDLNALVVQIKKDVTKAEKLLD